MAKYIYNPPYNQWSGNRSDTLNKWKVNYKGSIATASALPDKGEFKGDTYNVLEDGSNYMWNGTSWDKLDANTYIGATSEANGIRGLVPPATTSQIYSLLTGSGVWKSGAELGFAYDNAVVHRTGDETIGGNKTLTGVYDLIRTFPVFSITNTDTSAGNYCDLRFYHDTLSNRKALIRYSVGGTFSIACAHSESDSYLNGPSANLLADGSVKITSKNASDTKDLLAKADGTLTWDQKDITGDVHTTGDEDINGLKYFKSGVKVTNTLDLNASKTCLTCFQLTQENPNYIDLRFVVGDHRDESSNAYHFSCIRADPSTGFALGTRYDTNTSWMSGPSVSLDSRTGSFTIGARSGDISTLKYLTGYSNGTLAWNGQAIQTSSDKRVKTSLTFVPDGVLDSWEKVKWGQFQYLDAIKEKGPLARLHVGLIAQQVLAAFNENGFDACDYGILCHEVHAASPEVLDENGEVITPAKDAVDLWMARYTEALCMEAAYQRRRAERAEARIKALEDRLEALEAKFA